MGRLAKAGIKIAKAYGFIRTAAAGHRTARHVELVAQLGPCPVPLLIHSVPDNVLCVSASAKTEGVTRECQGLLNFLAMSQQRQQQQH